MACTMRGVWLSFSTPAARSLSRKSVSNKASCRVQVEAGERKGRLSWGQVSEVLLHASCKGPEERARDEKQLQYQACLEVTELLEKNVPHLWRATSEVLDRIVSKQLAQLQSSAWREQDCDPHEQTCNRPSSQPGPTHSNRQQRVQSKGLANVHGEVLKKASEEGASELHSWCFCRSRRLSKVLR